jgi:hypothetical protein
MQTQTIKNVVIGTLFTLLCSGAHATAYNFGELSAGESRSSLEFLGAGRVIGNFADTWSFQLADDGSTLTSAVSLNLSDFFHISSGQYGLYSGIVGSGSQLGSWSFDGTSGDAYNIVTLMSAGSYYLSVSGLADGTDGGLYTLSVAALSVTAPIPEPETYALLLAGLALIGFVARRRNGLAPA